MIFGREIRKGELLISEYDFLMFVVRNLIVLVTGELEIYIHISTVIERFTSSIHIGEFPR